MTARAKIHLLAPELRNQIAAGEVVERPASVVKELVENALDAKATEIIVRIEDGGQSLISAQDNGIGIPKEELELAVTRHATSKLQTVADLSNILSYGFRGEALPSIASVSRFRIVSKARHEQDNEQKTVNSDEGMAKGTARDVAGDIAHELCVNFGDIKEESPASLRQGTLIEVRDLFFNIPARLKFLKNPATELKRATDLFIRLALGADNVAMSLYAGSRLVVEFFPHEDKKDKLAKIWSSSIIDELLPVDFSAYGMKLTGYISNPRSVQPRADRMLFYVNGRAVNDKILLKAIRQAYAGKIISKDYPQCLLFLEIDPHEVDVNVHPAKSEVRFRDEKALFGLVAKAVDKALSAGCFSIRDLQEAEERLSNPKQEHIPQAKLGDLFAPSLKKEEYIPKPAGFWGNADKETRLSFGKTQQNEAQENEFGDFVVGYFQGSETNEPKRDEPNKYELKKNAPPVKEHESTAHELFDNMLGKEMGAGQNYLAEPAEHLAPLSKCQDFSAQDKQELQQNTQQYMPQAVLPYGFEYLGQVAETYLILKKENNALLLLDQHAIHERILYEEIKKGQVQVQHLLYPLELSLQASERHRYQEMKQTFAQLGFSLAEKEMDEQNLVLQITAIPARYDRVTAMGFFKEILADKMDDLDTIWVRHACKSAIKANTPLDNASAVKLILQWLKTEEPDNCPHGRPCVLHFDSKDLEKLFKRKT